MHHTPCQRNGWAIRPALSPLVLTCIAILGLSAAQALGATLYVDASTGSDSHPGTSSQPFQTITKAADEVNAGDVVVVRSGTYNERIDLRAGGNPGAPIVFKAEPRRTVNMNGFQLREDHVRIEGFNITTTAKGWKGGGIWVASSHVEVVDNYFHDIQDVAVSCSWSEPWQTNITIRDNRAYKCQFGFVIHGSDVLVEDNEVERVIRYGSGDADYSRFFGSNITFRGNYFHGSYASEIGTAHTDGFQTFSNNGWGAQNVLIEKNIVHSMTQGVMLEGLLSDNNVPPAHQQVRDITIINNVFRGGDIPAAWGVDCKEYVKNVQVLHNTFIDIMHHAAGFKDRSEGVVRNNIFVEGGSNYWAHTHNGASVVGGHNIILHPHPDTHSDPTDLVGVDPRLVNVAAGDYRVQPDSPAIDAAMPLPGLVIDDFDGTARPQGAAPDIGAYEIEVVVQGDPPSASLSAPTASLTADGPVQFTVNYTDADSVSLSPAQVQLVQTGSADAQVSVAGSGAAVRTITLQHITGDGTLAVALAASTASNAFGDAAAVDAGATVTVDNSAPQLTLQGANPMTLSAGATFSDPGASASDAREGNLNAAIVTSGSVNTAQPGSYVRTYSVQDSLGNSASVQRTVHVVDTTAPLLSLAGANPMVLAAGAAFNDPGASAHDNVDGNLTGAIVVSGNVNTAQPGMYSRTYTVSDAAGNSASLSRTVQVVDGAAPTLTLLGANPMTVEAGATFNDPGASADDSVDGNLTSAIVVSGSVNTDQPGAYTLTYRVEDSANNQVSATRTVNVVDTTAPQIILLGQDPMTVEAGASFNDPGANANDSVDGNLTSAITVAGSVDESTPGTVTLTYSVEDRAGNAASVSRTVTVADTTAPQITLLGQDPMTVAAGATFNDPGATASDSLDGNLTSAIEVAGSVDSETPGTYTLTYTVADNAGNEASLSRTVQVEAVEAPLPRARFLETALMVVENAGTIEVDVAIEPAPANPIRVIFAVGAPKADLMQHLPAGDAILDVAAGQSLATLSLPVADNAESHAAMAYSLAMVDVEGGEVGTPSLLEVTVQDDDEAPMQEDPCDTPFHSADEDASNNFGLSEILGAVQLFNASSYHVTVNGDYRPGDGPRDGCPHDSDYLGGADWRIELSELLRLVSLWRAPSYSHCPDAGTEDGFCPNW